MALLQLNPVLVLLLCVIGDVVGKFQKFEFSGEINNTLERTEQLQVSFNENSGL